MTDAVVVAGVDVGSLRTLSYIAWLHDRRFTLDLYTPTRARPIPCPPKGMAAPAAIAFDAPQSMAAIGALRREADRLANTPTRRLPADRQELAGWKLYVGLIEAGIEIFWGVHVARLGTPCGAAPIAGLPIVAETYPRYVIKRLWPDLVVPSKAKAPLSYVDAVWSRIQAAGFRCEGVARPCVDHVDAMICAIAAHALASTGGPPAGTVGRALEVDEVCEVLREGFIVSP